MSERHLPISHADVSACSAPSMSASERCNGIFKKQTNFITCVNCTRSVQTMANAALLSALRSHTAQQLQRICGCLPVQHKTWRRFQKHTSGRDARQTSPYRRCGRP